MQKFKLNKKFIQTDTGKIFYYINNGIQKKPTIILLHGLSANHSAWLRVADNLLNYGYNCLIPDLRGHGNSDKSKKINNYNLTVFSDDLKQILDQEKINKIILTGYSFGGAVALEFAYRESSMVSNLILISANHANPLYYTKWKIFIPSINAILYLFSFLIIWQKRKKYHYYQPNKSNGYWKSTCMGFRTMPWSVNIWLLLKIAKLDFNKRPPLEKLPSLIIYSKHDPFISSQELSHLKTILPKASFVSSNNFSHFIATHSQDEISTTLINYLKKYENSNF